MDQNTKDVLLLVVPLVGSTIAALVSGYVAIQLARVKETVAETRVDMARVEKNTNSITERLGVAKFAEGKAEGKAESKAESKEEAKTVAVAPVVPVGNPPAIVAAVVTVEAREAKPNKEKKP